MKKNNVIILEPEVDDLCFLLAKILAREPEEMADASSSEEGENASAFESLESTDHLTDCENEGRKQ